MGLAGYIIGVLNVITGLIAVLMVGGGIGVASRAKGLCERYVGWRVALVGVAILCVSLMGVAGAWYKRAWRVMYFYVGLVLLAAALVLATSIATLVLLSTQATVDVLQEKGETGAYFFVASTVSSSSLWLQKRLLQPHTWTLIKNCLSMSHPCSNSSLITLSPIQRGCCIPPSSCVTDIPLQKSNSSTTNSSSEDCVHWSDEQLCFDCSSCKAGVLLTLRNSRHKVAATSIMILLFILGVLWLGCCALHNLKANKKNARFLPKFRRKNPRGVHPSEEG